MLMQSSMRGWSSLYFVNVIVVVLHAQEATKLLDYTCDVRNDACPTQNNGVCDSLFGTESVTDPECSNGDCFDCNEVTCQQFHYDCQTCVGTVGCFWCPLDGTCQNSNLYDIVAVDTNMTNLSECLKPSDFVTAVTATVDDRNATIQNVCEGPESSFFRDPLYTSQQWILDMINVEAVWKEGFTGKDIKVRVNDRGIRFGSGFQSLDDGQFDPDGGCTVYEPVKGVTGIHGNQVASIIGASGDNGRCGVGIAPDVTLSSCNVESDTNMTYFDSNLENMDISVHSLGIVSCSSAVAGVKSVPSSTPSSNPSQRKLSSSRNDTSSESPILIRRSLQRQGRTTSSAHSRILQDDEDDDTRTSSSCPLDSDSLPCQACPFSSSTGDLDAKELVSCENALTEYCLEQLSLHHDSDARTTDSVTCKEYPDLLMKLLPTADIERPICDFHSLPPPVEASLANGVNNGRDEKGVIYVVPAVGGTGIDVDDDGQIKFSPLSHSRHTITVGAVGRDGLTLSNTTVWSTSAVLVTAPGGNESPSRTTSGTDLPISSCTPPPFGNEFAAPIVSGVIALALDANPDLTWRDIQGILVETSQIPPPNNVSSIASRALQEEEPADDTSEPQTSNQAGWNHSDVYGFGIVDAGAAVEAAKSWELYCPEEVLLLESGLIESNLVPTKVGTEASKNMIGVNNTISFDDSGDYIIESVVVVVDLVRFSKGNWKVVLMSPSGTKSTLLGLGNYPEILNKTERWKLLTVKNWGESVAGDWTLSVTKPKAESTTSDEDKPVGECVDAPYESSYLGTEYTCSNLEEQGFCANGVPDPETFGSGQNNDLLVSEFEGLTLEGACCACGGGTTTDSSSSSGSEDQLAQWRLVIYGRYKECSKTTTDTSPSSAPTEEETNDSKESKKEDDDTTEVEKDPAERTATILATVASFALIALCLVATLREPSHKRGGRELMCDDNSDDFHDEDPIHDRQSSSWMSRFLPRKKTLTSGV